MRVSSNGRTQDFGSCNGGSSPLTRTLVTAKTYLPAIYGRCFASPLGRNQYGDLHLALGQTLGGRSCRGSHSCPHR
jgi:hypothetical protein